MMGFLVITVCLTGCVSMVAETAVDTYLTAVKVPIKVGTKVIKAIIPGTIQRIMAKEGEEVTAGTPLLILEAMKMRNEVLSPVNGVVTKIHVSEGEMVSKAHLLIEMD